MLVVLGALVISVPLTGGRLTRLGTVQLRRLELVAAAIVVQVVVLEVLHRSAPPAALAALHLGTYLLGGLFVLVNRSVPGLWLLGVGAVANFAAIAANGGVMPASVAAMSRAGLSETPDFANSASLEGARLALLGDVFAIPSRLPFANVFSVGDILILLGAAWLLHRTSRGAEHVAVQAAPAPAHASAGGPAVKP